MKAEFKLYENGVSDIIGCSGHRWLTLVFSETRFNLYDRSLKMSVVECKALRPNFPPEKGPTARDIKVTSPGPCVESREPYHFILLAEISKFKIFIH